MEFITDPDDPMVTDIYNNLSIINDKIITSYDRGIISTEFLKKDIDKEEIDKINQINYESVSFALSKKYIETLEIQKELIVSSLAEILKHIIDISLNVPVSYIDVQDVGEYFIFTPYTDYDTLVYQNSKYLNDFYDEINLESLSGYTVLE